MCGIFLKWLDFGHLGLVKVEFNISPCFYNFWVRCSIAKLVILKGKQLKKRQRNENCIILWQDFQKAFKFHILISRFERRLKCWFEFLDKWRVSASIHENYSRFFLETYLSKNSYFVEFEFVSWASGQSFEFPCQNSLLLWTLPR